MYIRPNTYTFVRDGIEEHVPLEAWCWEAHYIDGTSLKQFDAETGIFHQLKEIDQKNMKVFRMIDYERGAFYDIDWHPSRKLIHKYIRTVLHAQTPQEQKYTSYAFGYETHVNGVSHKVILVVLPDDNVVVTENTDRIQLENIVE